MSNPQAINWTGQSGRTYTYYIYPIGTSFHAKAGNYIFAKETSPNSFRPVYVGETGNLSARFGGHHAMPCIERNGATHIHVHSSSSDRNVRLAEETDIVRKWAPACNG